MAKESFVRAKPHVNIGTIGHVDHGKTTLTASILAVQAKDGLAEAKEYSEIAKGGTVRDETKTVTIAVAHVEYESETRHYAHPPLSGSRRLREEYDHRRCANGRRDFGGGMLPAVRCRKPKSTCCSPNRWAFRASWVALNKSDLVDDG